MKKTGIVLTVIIFFNLAITIFQSCCEPGTVTHKLESLQAELKRITGIEVSGSLNSGNFIVEEYQPGGNGIRYDSLGIRINNNLTVAENITPRLNLGGSNLYACEPGEEYDILSEVIITSSEDYNDAYPKGSNLDEIMNVRNYYSVQGNNISYFMANKQLDNTAFFYTFTYPPSADKYHDITFKYYLVGGGEYHTTINGILIKK